MSKIEREIKILNVNIKDVMKKLEANGAKLKGKYIQEIYTFNFPTLDEEYKKRLHCTLNTGDKSIILDFIKDIKPCFTKEDVGLICSILGTEDIIKYIEENGDLNSLDLPEIYELMKKTEKNYSKWIRLRKTGNITTITIKKIVNCSGDYELDAVRELEFEVPSIEDGKEFLKSLGYYPALHQEKMRIAYDLDDTEVVVDKWPMIPPYIEVESTNKDSIIRVVKNIGFKEEDMRILNTDEVYKENGIDIYSYKNLILSSKEREDVNKLLNDK